MQARNRHRTVISQPFFSLPVRLFSTVFFNEVGRITKGELGVEILYTSGLFFAEEKCVWDGFFEEAAKFKNAEEIEKKFQSIDGVNSVEIEFIKL